MVVSLACESPDTYQNIYVDPPVPHYGDSTLGPGISVGKAVGWAA